MPHATNTLTGVLPAIFHPLATKIHPMLMVIGVFTYIDIALFR
jgi:hypothetical protein